MRVESRESRNKMEIKKAKKHPTPNPGLRTGNVISVNISDRKGISKKPVSSIRLIRGNGVEDDAHAGGERQVSLLMIESAKKIKEFEPGLFAENITVNKIDLSELKLGDKIKINDTLLSLKEIGKTCPRKCAIYYKLGDCIMPKTGLFFDVIKEGTVKKGDKVEVI